MPDVISPRRGESITNPEGWATNRFMEYLERNSTETNILRAAAVIINRRLNELEASTLTNADTGRV